MGISNYRICLNLLDHGAYQRYFKSFHFLYINFASEFIFPKRNFLSIQRLLLQFDFITSNIKNKFKCIFEEFRGWSGGAMVLGNLPVPGRPTIWITVGQGPTALAVGAGGVVWTFLLSSILSLLFLPHFGRRPDID